MHKRVRDSAERTWWWTVCPMMKREGSLSKKPMVVQATDQWARVTCKLCLRARAKGR